MAGGNAPGRMAGATAGRLRLPWRFRTLREDRGDTLVEFAITSSLLFLFILGLTQMCLAFYTWQWISELAREGTRYAIVRGATCETASGGSCEASVTDIENYVKGLKFPDVGGGTLAVTASFPDGDEAAGHRVQVQVTYSYPYNIPGMSKHILSMKSTSEMPIIQ